MTNSHKAGPEFIQKESKQTAMQISVNRMELTAKEFRKAGEDMQEMVEHLEKQMAELQEAWSDAGQQVFFEYYREWRERAGGFSVILKTIGQEIDLLAEHYHKADTQSSDERYT